MLFFRFCKKYVLPFSILLFSVLFFTNSTKAQTLLRGPYLTSTHTQGITIRWRTDVASNSRVTIGVDAVTYPIQYIDTNNTTEHEINVNGLLPNSKYYYSIGTTTTTLQAYTDNYFYTHPVSSKDYTGTIRIQACGDMGRQTLLQQQVRDNYLSYLNNKYVHAWIMIGDNAYENGTNTDYQLSFFNYYQNNITKNTPLFPCVGNHDYANDYTLRTTHSIPYFDIFTLPSLAQSGGIASNTEMYYSFNIGNVHCINLDSYGLENVGGIYYGLSDTAFSLQYQWLKNDLQANVLSWIIVSFHHPPYCMGSHNSDTEPDLIALREKLNPLLEKYNVDLVLNGHCHTYQRSKLLRNHFGYEPTFDSTIHNIQTTSGRYDSINACPYIKNNHSYKDSGVLYCVIGSASKIPTSLQATWPHNAMYFNNATDGGTLLITIKGNRLDAEWISSNVSHLIQDKFTIFKNVNTTLHLSYLVGDTINLEASWDGEDSTNYIWNTTDSTKSITQIADTDKVITVQDKYGCLHDTFYIHTNFTAALHSETPIDFILYPNPTNHEIFIKTNNTTPYSISIFDINSKLIYQNKISSYPNQKINLTGWSTGFYIIECKFTNGHIVRKKCIVSEQ